MVREINLGCCKLSLDQVTGLEDNEEVYVCVFESEIRYQYLDMEEKPSHSSTRFSCLFLKIFLYFFIGIRFANIQYNTQCSSCQVPPSPSHPIPLPNSPSTTPCLFPRVMCLSCFVTLTDISHSFPLLSHIIPFTISYIPHQSEII